MNKQPDIQSSDNFQSPNKRRRSPNAGSFKKGVSGNRNGRPPGSCKHAAGGSAYQSLLGKTVTITLRGKTHEMPLEEAIQHRTFKDALAGKIKAIRQALGWIKEREAWLKQHQPARPSRPMITREFSPDPDNADRALMVLGITRVDQYRASWGKLERTPLLIQPWAVELALRRNRNGARFSEEDWNAVKRCTQELGDPISTASRAPGDTDEQS